MLTESRKKHSCCEKRALQYINFTTQSWCAQISFSPPQWPKPRVLSANLGKGCHYKLLPPLQCSLSLAGRYYFPPIPNPWTPLLSSKQRNTRKELPVFYTFFLLLLGLLSYSEEIHSKSISVFHLLYILFPDAKCMLVTCQADLMACGGSMFTLITIQAF